MEQRRQLQSDVSASMYERVAVLETHQNNMQEEVSRMRNALRSMELRMYGFGTTLAVIGYILFGTKPL